MKTTKLTFAPPKKRWACILPFSFLFCLFTFAVLTSTFAQIESNKVSGSDKTTSQRNSSNGTDGIQTVGDKIIIRNNNNNGILQIIEETNSAASILFYDKDNFNGASKRLNNYQGNLYWGTEKLGTASSAGGWTNISAKIYNTNSTDKVGIGTTNPLSQLSVGGNGTSEAAIYGNSNIFGIYGNSTGTNGRGVIGNASGISGVGVRGIATNTDGRGVWGSTESASGWAGYFTGNIYVTGSYSGPSDLRYKKDIKPFKNALNSILKLNCSTYRWKTEEFPERNFNNDKLQVGVIAQDLEKVFPNLVETDKDGYKSVDYIKLSVITMQAVKELNADVRNENKGLKERIIELEKQNSEISIQNSELTNRLNKIESLLNGKRFTTVNK
jgi:hypothetical protein